MQRIKKEIKKNKSKPLSNTDLVKLVDGETNLIKYGKLSQISNIDEILDPWDACIILYETSPNVGHWVCLFRMDDNNLEFFDPYAFMFDEEQLRFNKDESFKKQTHQDYPYLTNLLYHSPYKVHYNEYPLQKKANDTSTCGRFVALRLLLKDLSLEKFNKIMNMTEMIPDDFATLLTSVLLNNKNIIDNI